MTRLPENGKELSLEMRVLLAFALSALVLILFAPKSRKAPTRPEVAPPPVAARTEPGGIEPSTETSTKPGTKRTTAAGAAAKKKPATAKEAAPAIPKQGSNESETVLE